MRKRGKKMKRLPKGISNYETIVRENYIYVDKMMYIEKLENLADRTIMFLRPRKFGKTLFKANLYFLNTLGFFVCFKLYN